MSDQGAGDTTEGAAPQSPDSTSPAADVPDWAKPLLAATEAASQRFEAIDGRLAQFGKDFGRLRERFRKDDAPPQPPGDSQTAGLSRDDLATGIKLHGLRERLSENVNTQLDALAEAGLPLASVLATAEAILAGGAGSAGATPTQPKTGRAATAASQTSQPQPRTRAELAKLAETDPKRYEQLFEDPAFDPFKLPLR